MVGPLPSELTAHQPPALLVDAVLRVDPAGGLVQLRPGPLDALQLAEGCAQAIACLLGARARQAAAGAPPASGMLVGLKDVVCSRPARSGELVTVETVSTYSLGALGLHSARALGDDGAELLSGEWKTMGITAEPR